MKVAQKMETWQKTRTKILSILNSGWSASNIANQISNLMWLNEDFVMLRIQNSRWDRKVLLDIMKEKYQDRTKMIRKIDRGLMRQEHGLDTSSGSRYFHLRNNHGFSDTKAQYYVHNNIRFG